jgi:hypothetical protein
MANIKNDFSDYNKFYLVSIGIPPLEIKDLVGWEGYGLDGARNLEYHGTLESVSKKVSFKGDAKRYIEDVYRTNGILGDLRLVRLKLRNIGDDVKWVQQDPVYADFETYDIKDNLLSLNFYSNSLMEVITAHEDDDFEIERLESIDNEVIEPLQENYVTLKGRSMTSHGESNYDENTNPTYEGRLQKPFTVPTKILSQGPRRHSSINKDPNYKYTNLWFVDNSANFNISGSELFYVNSVTVDAKVTLNFTLDLKANLKYDYFNYNMNYGFYQANPLYASGISIAVFEYNDVTNNFETLYLIPIKQYVPLDVPISDLTQYNGYFETIRNFSIDLEYNQGATIVFGALLQGSVVDKLKINLNEVEYFEQSTARFLFYHDVIDRLMYILTGSKNKLVSSVLGREQLEGYSEDGEAGLVGFLSGMWARQFTVNHKSYKSPKISLKDALSSISNCFNLGYGVETINNDEKLVVEKLQYFYRDDIFNR